VELAVGMIQELRAAYRAAPSKVKRVIAQDVIELWRQAAEARDAGARAAGREVVTKGYSAPSVDHGIAGHYSARSLTAVEAAPGAAFLGLTLDTSEMVLLFLSVQPCRVPANRGRQTSNDVTNTAKEQQK